MIMSLASCSTYRYIFSASPPNNPYFSKKGESKISGYYSDGGTNRLYGEKANGFDLHGAYALSDHWAITTGYFKRNERDVFEYSRNRSPFDSSVVHYERNLYNIGGGYFTTINSKKTITLNLFAGVGFGKFAMDDDGTNNGALYSRKHSSDITRYYFQPALNFSPYPFFRFSFVLKTSLVHYKNSNTSYTASEQEYFSLDQINDRVKAISEPAVNIQLGLPQYPWVKLDATLSGASNPFSAESHLQVRGNNASIGLSFDLSKLKK